MVVVEISETAAVTKENAALKGVRTAETHAQATAQATVQETVQYDVNASAANVRKDASVSVTTEQAMIEEAVAVSAETITEVEVALVVAAVEQVLDQRVAATASLNRAEVTIKATLAVPEEDVEVSSRKLTLDSKD